MSETTRKLREKVLDLAFSGHLIPSTKQQARPVVLNAYTEKKKEIKAAKWAEAKLVDNEWVEINNTGSQKKISMNYLYQLPPNWLWIKFGSIGKSELGKTLNAAKDTGVLTPYLCSINVDWGACNLTTVKVAKFSDAEKQKYKLNFGDLLVCEGGDVGRCCLWESDQEMYFQNAIHRIVMYGKIKPRFLMWYLHKLNYKGTIKQISSSVTIKHFTKSKLDNLFIPVPPLEEQNRIVDKIEQLFKQIDEIERQEAELEKNVELAKEKILDLSFSGKLTLAETNSGSQLLDIAFQEKKEVKKTAKKTIIEHSEEGWVENVEGKKRKIETGYLYRIPDNWVWTKFDTIANSELGKTLNAAKDTGEFVPYLCSMNVKWGETDLSNVKQARFTDMEKEKYLLHKGDLLICEGGDVGRCCLWNSDKEMYFQNALHRVKLFGSIEPNYFRWYLNYLNQKGIIKSISSGVTIKHFTKNKLDNLYIPLPPLEDQIKIESRIEAAFKFLSLI
ncbi:restriction endonuclease subunit S [Ileibacterium valens]|uniref:restriction endonuclease subunit S n=1 Tax=Ileibacterium valens TaxID=1862668 RepID=UPI00272BCD23|nr:restriction endonuclease subunit S [Ileibacterium valens]